MKQKQSSKNSSQQENQLNDDAPFKPGESESGIPKAFAKGDLVDSAENKLNELEQQSPVLQPVVSKPVNVKSTKPGLKLSPAYMKRAKRLKLL